VSVPRTRPAESPARSTDGADLRRRGRIGAGDLIALAALVAGAGLIEFWLRHLLTRPFYSDEAWRAYDISLGPAFLRHLDTSAAPLALGWVAIEDAARLVLGDTEAGLRAPMFVCLPALACATYLLARRWLGVGVSFGVAALLLVNSWTVNNALQLKSYSYEGLLAIAAVALYLLVQRACLGPARLLGLYALMGLTCVFSLPNLFVLAPLLALDLVGVVRAREQVALRVGGEALAGAIALLHYVMFVRPQAACNQPLLTPVFRQAPATWSSSRPTGTRRSGTRATGCTTWTVTRGGRRRSPPARPSPPGTPSQFSESRPAPSSGSSPGTGGARSSSCGSTPLPALGRTTFPARPSRLGCTGSRCVPCGSSGTVP